MDHLTQNQKSLAWHMVQDAKVLLTTYEQWQAYLEADTPNNDFWRVCCEITAENIENAIQMAKGFSVHIAQYYDDFSRGRAPGFKEAIEFAIEPAEPGRLTGPTFELWMLRVDRYADFFSDALEFHRVLNLPEVKSKLPSTYRPPWIEALRKLEIGYVTAEDVSQLLESKKKIYTAKTLKNNYKASWGNPDGNEGRAQLFDWNRIRPIVEEQFNVKFEG